MIAQRRDHLAREEHEAGHEPGSENTAALGHHAGSVKWWSVIIGSMPAARRARSIMLYLVTTSTSNSPGLRLDAGPLDRHPIGGHAELLLQLDVATPVLPGVAGHVGGITGPMAPGTARTGASRSPCSHLRSR